MKIAGFLALGILLLYFAFRGLALDELFELIIEANFWWVALSLLFLTLSFISRARRWVLLIEPLEYSPTFKNTFNSMMVGYLANYALPRLGEISRCVSLGRKEKIPVDSLFGTVIVERAFDMLMLFIILFILLITWLEKFGAFFRDQIFSPIRERITETMGGMLFFWGIIFVSVLLLIALLYIFRKKLYRFKLFVKIIDIFKGVFAGLKTVIRMKRKWEFIFHSIFIWICYILMTWVMVFSLSDTSNLTFVDAMFLLVLGGFGFAAPVTAGFGAYHWLISRGLHFVYGLSLEQGGAYAILTHESNSLYTILLGAVSMIILFSSRKREKALIITDPDKNV